MTTYVVRKINRTLYELNPMQMHVGKEVECLDGIYESLDKAKRAIKNDKIKFGDTYIYLVTENKTDGNILIVYKE